MPDSSLPRARSWPFWPVAGLLCLGWLMFVWPWLSGRLTIPWDAKAHFYPQLVFLADALAQKSGFSWNPFVFSGQTQIADPQSLIFSPPHQLLARLSPAPGFVATDMISFGMLLAGAVAVLLYFRDRNWHPAGALVAALAFAFGGSAAWRIQHTGQILSLAYFPIVLLLVDRALLRSSLAYGALAGLVGAFLALGRDQVAGLSGLVLIGYALSHIAAGEDWRARARAAQPPAVAAILVGLLVLAVPLTMTAISANLSNRSYIDYEGAARGSYHPANLITAFLANIFGTNGDLKDFWGAPSPYWPPLDLYVARNMGNIYSGALVALAIVFGAAGGGLWKRGARFFGLALLVLLLYTLGRYTPFFRLAYSAIPGVDFFRRPADGTFLIGALAAYAAGHVVHVVASGETHFVTRAGRIALSVSLAALLSGVALALARGRLGYAWPMILEGAGWLAAAMAVAVFTRRIAAQRPLAAAALLGLFLSVDLIRNNGPNDSTALPPQMYENLRPGGQDATMTALKSLVAGTSAPDRMDRIEIAAIDFHSPNASMVHKLSNTLGYNPLRDSLYTAAVGAGDTVALADQRGFPPLFPSYASPLANLLGLRFIATGVPLKDLDKALPEGALREVAKTANATIFENPNALPRVMIVPRAEVVQFETILASGRWPRSDFQDTVLLEEMPPGAVMGDKRGSARILRYTNTEVLIEADAPEGGFLVLNDLWHPWWYGYINDDITEVRRANLMFRAVTLPPGRHSVRFTFRPLRGMFASLTDVLSGRALR
jgi:hypothetical protein